MSVDLGMPSTRGHRLWPDDVLDVDGLRATGWRPRPIRQYILKINSRCNLACDYCYVYGMADQSWRDQPVRMAAAVVGAASRRIAEHARRHRLSAVQVVLHGGEPLLAGPEPVREIVSTVRSTVGAQTAVHFGLQTNGVLLDGPFLAVLAELDVAVAVSIDGGPAANDSHRRYANGKGSYAQVARALHLLRHDYRQLYSGLLCTIDIANDPIATYEALLEFAPPSVDFLLPHANWGTPPARRGAAGGTEYADWLSTIFDRWYASGGRETRVRYFEEIMATMFGAPSRTEMIGLSPVALVVVETDGTLQQVDTLKSTAQGAARTGLNVFDDSMDDVLGHPSIAARQLGHAGLSGTCQSCAVHRICGGGYYPHRYDPGNGFLNPSVYCADLKKLITHIRDTVARDLDTPPPGAAR
ncbi:FxsB family cyclophane-forming radical SAM/SPASM peptide maturase [Plantactinospora sp. WMMB334]|uniref:FxsB family cyclophane-forming radical SAM/SPASM peptide maturase n=1 Tax=Plantactinospora sp. WMMB334 TaxID=3404119 RepID=UPI003B937AC6